MKFTPRKVATAVGIAAVVGGFVFISLPVCGCYGPDPKIVTLSCMKMVGQAIQLYLVDYDNVFPGVQDQPSFHTLIYPYTKSSALLDGPNDVDHRVKVEFNTRLSNVIFNSLPDPRKTPMLTSPYAKSAAAPVSHYLAAFADGYMKAFPISTWNADYANLLDRNYPRVSQTFLPASP